MKVCIIDDREDVWNYARNLICVQPYVYFKNTGDINDPTKSSSFKNAKKRKMFDNLSQQSQQNKAEVTSPTTSASLKSSDAIEQLIQQNEANLGVLGNLKSNELIIDNNSVDSVASTNSTDSAADKPSKKKEPSSKKAKICAKNKENSVENFEEDTLLTSPVSDKQTTETDDPDDYLDYLENILKKIHDEYYKIYDNRIQTTKSDRSQVDETDLPDLKRVIPLIKSKVLEGVVITFSGVVPTDYDLKKQRCYLMATALGAKVNEHLVLGNSSDSSDDEDHKVQVQK